MLMVKRKVWSLEFVLLFILFLFPSIIGFGQQSKKLPEYIRKVVFKESTFGQPILMDLPSEDDPNIKAEVTEAFRRSHWFNSGDRSSHAALINPYFLSLLTQKGFAKVEEITLYGSACDRWDPERNQIYKYKSFSYLKTIDPYIVKGSYKYAKNYLWVKSFSIILGHRKLVSIDYTNQYKASPSGVPVTFFALTFTYSLTSGFPGLPQKNYMYKGKAVAYLDPDDGQWKLGSMSGEGLTLEDDGAQEYLNLLESVYQKPPEIHWGSTLENTYQKLSEIGSSQTEQPRQEKTGVQPELPLDDELDSLCKLPAKTDEEFKKFSAELYRTVDPAKTAEIAKLFDKLNKLLADKALYDKVDKATKEKKRQEVVDTYQRLLQVAPQYYAAFYMIADSYNELNQPDKALEYALKGLRMFQYNLLYAIVAESYSQKGDKTRALAWLEGALKGGFRTFTRELDENFGQYKNDPEYISLLQKYRKSSPGTATSQETSQQRLYEIQVDGLKYSVIKTSNEKIYGSQGSRGFLDADGKKVTNPSLVKKLVKTAWVCENLVQEKPSLTIYGSWDKPTERIYLIKGIMETFKDIKKYEKAQDLLVRTWVDLSATVISGSSSTASITKTLGNLTMGNLQDALLSEASLKSLLGYVSVESLEESLKNYELCEEKIGEAQNGILDYSMAEDIYNLYMEGYIREPYEKLLIALMPKRASELVLKGLKSAGSEVVSLLISPAIKTTEAGKQALTSATMIKGIDMLYNTLGGMPEFREFGDAIKLVRGRIENADKTMQALEEKALKGS